MNNYHLLDQIGEGSFGRVYKARRKFTGRIVAIKMINKLGQSKDDILSFRREIDILKKVDHPNIMRHIEIFETNTDFCLVSELARGDLFQIINDNATLPEEVLKSVAAQLVSALTNLHQHRIIHRDMKPQNVLICANGALKVCDFGFARALSCTTLVLTSIKGTPLYMAPELVQEQPYDEKVDIWSLGVILYELYYGKPPFFTNSIYKLIQMIVNEKITWPGKISDQFKDFLLQMLQKDPQRRSSCANLLTHPFISKVPLTPFDDSDYRMKKQQFDEAIEESLSDTASLPFQPPESTAPDYQGILLNPSTHTPEELLMAVKFLSENDKSLNENDVSNESPLAASFAYHFTEFITKPLVAEEALKAATMLLKSNPADFLTHFKVGVCILGEPDMPHAAIDFFTELLVVPYVVKMVNLIDLSQNDLLLDDEKAEKLRDKLLSFLFTSDPIEASKTYAFMSFLVQVSPIFVTAISGQFVSQVVPIITSSVIHRTSSPVTAGALAILAKIVEKNSTSIQYIQPITDFVESFFAILKKIPTSLESFCVFSAAMSFLSITYSLISQLSSFQQLFNLSSKSSDIQTFILQLYDGNLDQLSQSLLTYGCEMPQTQVEYLSFVSILSSPFSHLPISTSIIDSCISQINRLTVYHQPSLLNSIFSMPLQNIMNALTSLLHLFDVSSCADRFAEFLLKHVKSDRDPVLVASLVHCNVPVKLSQFIAEYGPATTPAVISLLTHIVLLNQKPTPELVNQAGDILRSVFAVDVTSEAALIIAAHFARLGSDFIEILEQCGALVFAEQQLKSNDSAIRALTLNFAGNVWKNGPLREDVAERIFPQIFKAMKTEKDKKTKRFAAFTVGNALYSSPEFGSEVLKEFDIILKLFDDQNVELVDCAAGIISSLLHKDDSYVSKLAQNGAFEKMFSTMSKNEEAGNRIIMRIPTLCKYDETRKLLKVKANRTIIQKYTKSSIDVVKSMAQAIIRIIDA
ncbi:AGC family protein kinase [Tritrichomonas foetus]|uniref:non-specific serine/threonine protein kinase n=1 Tax=Tritrichomonas foetus TaxID=1144522 RepID=A0A1J4JHA0_9EUKA|nr:AGC family protein kinase [Tritrichomonas foetus]|eukprot:OHS98510.1 AGC family protein kinase [Tritrichomonas foetus]